MPCYGNWQPFTPTVRSRSNQARSDSCGGRSEWRGEPKKQASGEDGLPLPGTPLDPADARRKKILVIAAEYLNVNVQESGSPEVTLNLP